MKAVNLLPGGSGGRAPRVGGSAQASPRVWMVVGALAALVAATALYASARADVKDNEKERASVEQVVVQTKATADRLAPYIDAEKELQTRIGTVRKVAMQRFNWSRAFDDASRVTTARTTLTALKGKVSGEGDAAGKPTLLFTGCTATQTDVARLMRRLRQVSGVTRVTLKDAVRGGEGEKKRGESAECDKPYTFNVTTHFETSTAVPSTGAGAPAATPPADDKAKEKAK